MVLKVLYSSVGFISDNVIDGGGRGGCDEGGVGVEGRKVVTER